MKKSARLGLHSRSELDADFTPWTPTACGVPTVPAKVLEVESEEEDIDKRVDEFGRRWFRSEVCPWKWYLLDTSNGVVRWDEPG